MANLICAFGIDVNTILVASLSHGVFHTIYYVVLLSEGCFNPKSGLLKKQINIKSYETV
jgi:hypothetical protein